MAYKIKTRWQKGTRPIDKFYPVKDVYVSDSYINDDKSKIISISKYKGKNKSYWTNLMDNKTLKIISAKKTKTRKEALKVVEQFKEK